MNKIIKKEEETLQPGQSGGGTTLSFHISGPATPIKKRIS